MLYNSILETIGKTPVIKLQKVIEQFLESSKIAIYVKNETFNPGGSHKTRIAFNMIKDAEKKGILKPNSGQTILEPTGGNTGLGIAIAGAVLGYKVILIIPDNYSPQKQNLLKALGAKIILSDSKKGGNSHGELALEILFDNPNYVMLNQSSNPANPEIHRLTTAQEILADFSDKSIDYFVGGIGTGGHITGIGEILKKENPNIQIIGVQPNGCEIFKNQFIPHKIQGLAVGIIPDVLNINIINKMISVTFEESRQMMKYLIRQEGLLVGLSSGANLAAALKIVHELNQNQPLNKEVNILTMAYDSAIDYLELLD